MKRKDQEMFDLAEEIEREFLEDLGKHIAIFVKLPRKVVLRPTLRRAELPKVRCPKAESLQRGVSR